MIIELILLLSFCVVFGDTRSVSNDQPEEPTGKSDSYVNSCPQGWERFGDKCVTIVGGGTKYSWAEAETICKQHDAHLASVHSKKELDFLNSYYLREYLTDKTLADSWIGGFKSGIFWSWLDLSPFDFTDWFPGRPNEQGPCIYLTTNPAHLNVSTAFGKMANTLNTDNCNNKLNFICQK